MFVTANRRVSNLGCGLEDGRYLQNAALSGSCNYSTVNQIGARSNGRQCNCIGKGSYDMVRRDERRHARTWT